MRRYGFGAFQPSGYLVLASSSDTAGTMMTSSPCFQFTGVATWWFAGELAAIEQAQYLVEVATGAHRVGEHGLDAFVRADYEDRTHGGVVHRCAPFGGVAGVLGEHVEELRNFQFGVADQRVGNGVALGFLDVLHPLGMVGHGIDRQAQDLAVARRKVAREASHVAEFRGAHGGEILGVGE